ncbi:hypothetical protein G9A89_023503 [Geosiphon pyriformis]|nr:hypothetical protein G9A89_023503 [Geosiphon pyriformis]
MNAIVALVHFCEVEGPSVMFCTQAFHANTSEDLVESSHSDSSGSTSPLFNQANSPDSAKDNIPANSRKDSFSINRTVPSSTCASCAFLLPPVEEQNHPQTKKATDFKGFKTEDDENASVTYIGSRYPQHPQLYAAVRKACVSSLSCEFCPQREGPVLFGDEKHGYVLSYMFKIKDSQARGYHRFYSFIFLMTDRAYLVASWPFLVSKFRILATGLQSKADQIFEKEKPIRERSEDSFMPRSGPFPQTSPDQFLRRRANQPLRSLVDLLGSKDLFVQLHANFSWILKASGRRLQERQVYGETLGNQLIIRSADKGLVETIINVIKDLIPRKCCSIIEYDSNYQDMQKCNLLGLNASANIPDDVDKSTICLLDIQCNSMSGCLLESKEAKTSTNFKCSLKYGTEEKYGKETEYNYKNTPNNPRASNLFMNQLHEILESNLSSDLMDMRLMIFKESWLSKAQLFLRFIQFGTGNLSSGGVGVGHFSSSLNGGSVMFESASSNPSSILKQKEFLKQLNIDEHDLPIVKFWTGYYRNGC